MTNRYELEPFFEYCAKKELELMKEDKKYIYELCKDHYYLDIKETLREYAEVWIKNKNKDMAEQKKQNFGRFQANFWLLKKMKGINNEN